MPESDSPHALSAAKGGAGTEPGAPAGRAVAGEVAARAEPSRPESPGPRYRRILLKISGEALMGDQPAGLDPEVIDRIAREIREVHDLDVAVCLVVGAGNIYRGLAGAAAGMDRATGDYMGMLGTVINALALQNALERLGMEVRVQSAIPMAEVCESYIRRRADRHLAKGRVVIFAAGTGSPYFTTDTAAALRASEMGCEALLKGTSVDGVYSADPKRDPEAIHIPQLTHHDVLSRDLGVMDAAAVTLARENGIPILVFSLAAPHAVRDAVTGRGVFSLISEASADHDTG